MGQKVASLLFMIKWEIANVEIVAKKAESLKSQQNLSQK
jgi:hypothetical protein